jgi:putative heme iron utilization protein
MSNARAARQMLRSHRYGALCTLSKKFNGHPFGSIVPYLVDRDGSLLILISSLAEHTRNIQLDPRVSLVTHSQDSPDIQSQGRITLVGEAQPAAARVQIGKRYLRYFPESQNLFTMDDFSFYRIVPHTLRFIGGFGKIHWVSADSYLVPPYLLTEQEDDVVTHMNEDHRDTLRHYWKPFHQDAELKVEMLGIDCDGFDLCADSKILRIDFAEEVLDVQQARRALISMAQGIQ